MTTHSPKCIVHGCTNHKHQGQFNGDLCMPCYTMLSTGKVSYTSSFLGELHRENLELRATLCDVVQSLENGSACSIDSSVEFLKVIPHEVRSVVSRLQKDLEDALQVCMEHGEDGTHECGPQCSRVLCVLRRQRDEARQRMWKIESEFIEYKRNER